MSNDSNYPEVEFIETDVETIENSMIASYELITGRVLYPADPMRVFIAWAADIIIQQRVLINDSAKQNVPRYAKGEYLDNLAEVFKDTYRLPAQASTATLRFYISEAQSNPVYIKEGTRVTVDGEIVFATEKTLEIK
ncbi:MAG: baseplate J/gp47 family protein, partial [Anaerovoracaceae bacterium]